jgi:hypothetical protein
MMKRLHLLTLTCSLLMLAGSGALGSDLVLSSLTDAGGNGFFVDSSGQALASGSLVQVVDCGELTETEIRELAAGGVETLLNAVTPFGDPTVIGQGIEDLPGHLEVVVSVPLDEAKSGLHVVVLNRATVGDATEWLVLSVPGQAAADDPSGVAGFLAVHFEDAALVYGAETPDGFATAASVESYESWISTMLDESSPASDLLPGADPDSDQLSNLLEFALGSDPSDGGSRAQISVRLEETGVFMEYLRRSNDPTLEYTPEYLPVSVSTVWMPLADTPLSATIPTNPPPTGYEWKKQEIPSATATGLGRMRIERDTPD